MEKVVKEVHFSYTVADGTVVDVNYDRYEYFTHSAQLMFRLS